LLKNASRRGRRKKATGRLGKLLNACDFILYKMGFFVKIQRAAICKLYSVGGHYGAVVTHLGRKGMQHCVLAESDTGVSYRIFGFFGVARRPVKWGLSGYRPLFST
jgi:hypothetical protein